MSRVGKKPVPVPTGVTAKIDGQQVAVKGAKGELNFVVPDEVSVSMDGGLIKVDPRNDSKRARAMWGMSRAMINNLVTGVSKGFERKLEITGVGYKAEIKPYGALLSLGFSHQIEYKTPAGVSITAPNPTTVVIEGASKELVGQVAAEIRSFRKPEPYKGKGVKYQGEVIRRKAGKAGGK